MQKKSKVAMTIIEKQLHDFGGNQNVNVVLQHIGNAQSQRRKSFLKVAKENGKCPNLCYKGKLAFFKGNFGRQFYYFKNISSLELGLGLGSTHIDVIVVFCFSCSEGHREQGNLLWHDQNRRVVKARPIVTSCLGSGGTHSFEKKYVRFLFFSFNIFFRFTLCFDCNYVLALL